MATHYPTTPSIGVNFARRTATPEFELGTVQTGNQNRSWIYGVASGTVATGTCTLNTSTYAITDAAGTQTADTAFADGEYGWVWQTAGIHA